MGVRVENGLVGFGLAHYDRELWRKEIFLQISQVQRGQHPRTASELRQGIVEASPALHYGLRHDQGKEDVVQPERQRGQAKGSSLFPRQRMQFDGEDRQIQSDFGVPIEELPLRCLSISL